MSDSCPDVGSGSPGIGTDIGQGTEAGVYRSLLLVTCRPSGFACAARSSNSSRSLPARGQAALSGAVVIVILRIDLPHARLSRALLVSVGDEAWVNLWNVVTARKDDFGVTMDLRFYHDSEDITKMLANTALSRLRDRRADPATRPSLSVQ